MQKFFKNTKLVTFGILGALSLGSIILIIVFANKHGTTTQTIISTPSTSSVATWDGLTPGVSSQQDVTNKLGTPKSIDGNTFSFNSQGSIKDNQAVIEGGVANFFKEDIHPGENRTSDEMVSKYGTAQYILYGPDAVNGFYLFVYPSNGIAYLGNPNTKDMIEVWYFKPTTIDEFISKWASGYSKQPQNGAGY